MTVPPKPDTASAPALAETEQLQHPGDADLERRFGALRRLYGERGYRRLRQARVAVVGLGGVGSWAVEALARSGVAALVLIDLDHVAESNINRQIQALGVTVGQAKAQALRDRVADIHPGCEVQVVEDFVGPDNWPALLPHAVDVLIDACDQVRAKLTLALWSQSAGVPLVCVGAAGGKLQPQEVQVADLAEVTHDPLLASLRQRLRKARAAREPAPLQPRSAKGSQKLGVCCVFSREAVAPPVADCDIGIAAPENDGSLNCHGYGSSVTVTATFGMVAASQALSVLVRPQPQKIGAGLKL